MSAISDKPVQPLQPIPEIKSNTEDFDVYWDHIETILQHKERVKNNAIILAKRLAERGELHFAKALIEASYSHDNSKLFGIEFDFMRVGANKECLKLAIKQHCATNKHHVEAWGSLELMPRIALAELICDLKARSEEFGTDLREYIKGDFAIKNNLKFTSRVGKIIKDFLDLLLEPAFKKI